MYREQQAILMMLALYESPLLKHEDAAALRTVIEMAEKYLELKKRPPGNHS